MEDNHFICNPLDCTACSACLHSCAHKAIQMEISKEGFLYPQIEESKCTNCGLCRNICPSNRKTIDNVYDKQQPYLAWNNNDEERIASSSGGLFSAIANYVIEQGGVVCGAAYDSDMAVRHIIVDNAEDLEKLRGSKYVQSILGDVFKSIKSLLKEGRLVYFVGTPCQVAGLKSYLRKDYKSLISSDLICHGVPSEELFKKQVRTLESELGKKIVNILFRSKKRFGQGYDFQVVTSDEKSYFYCAELIPYFTGFWKNITLRESCYRCKYASLQRVGDITLADFWLVKKCFQDVRTSKGTSLVFVNSKKGGDTLDALKKRNSIFLRKATLEQALLGQGQLKSPVPRPRERDGYKDYNEFEKYRNGGILSSSLTYRMKMHLRNIIKVLILFKYWK